MLPEISTTTRLPQVWGLLDDRPGTAHQVEGVLKRLDYPSVTRRFTFNGKAKLPNFLLGATLSHTVPEMSDRLEPPVPDIIISAGRRLAPVALAIQQKMNPQAFLAHLMDPGMSAKRFDLIIQPFHDKPKARPNVMETLGAPNPITLAALKEAEAHWQHTIGALPGPRVALLIGGDTKEGKFTLEEAEELIKAARKLATNSGSLMVTTSYRTSPAIVTHLKEMLTGTPHHVFTYGSHGQNPYLAYLAYADIVLVTSDSISMISEACITGKPVYIFQCKHTFSRKHKAFAATLKKEKIAYPLSEFSPIWKGGRPLDEAEKIAARIRMGYTAKRKAHAL